MVWSYKPDLRNTKRHYKKNKDKMKMLKVFKKDGSSFNGNIKTELKSGVVIKATSGVNHTDYIWFCEGNVNEVIDNISGSSEISVWEVEPLNKVYNGHSLNYFRSDETYRYSKKVKLVRKNYEHLDYLKTKIDELNRIKSAKQSDGYKLICSKRKNAKSLDELDNIDFELSDYVKKFSASKEA